MKQRVYCVLLISLFWAAHRGVGALRCFQCLDVLTGPCFDPAAGNVTIANCEEVLGPGEHICFNVIGTENGNEMAMRGCLPYNNFNQFCSGVTTTANAICLGCREDLCNSSSGLGPINFTFLALSSLIILLSLV